MERKQEMNVKRDGKNVVVTRTIKDTIGFKEYLETLNNMNTERMKMKNQIESMKGQLDKGDVDKKKLDKFKEEIESILETGLKHRIETIKKTKEYKERPKETRNAFLFGNKDLMDYAPESLLKKAIWKKK